MRGFVFAAIVLACYAQVIIAKENVMRQNADKMKWIVSAVGLLAAVGVAAATIWPNVTGQDIGGGLAALYEPSGMTMLNNKLYVVTDEGEVTRMTTSGQIEYTTATQSTTLRSQSTGLGLGSDLEAISSAPASDSYLYLGYEGTNMMAQFDVATMKLTGKVWSFNSVLAPVIGTDTANGMEALVVTPNYVIAGLQHGGQLYYFTVNFDVSGSTPTYLETVNMVSLASDSSLGSDIADLSYSSDTKNVYALYDAANKIVELNESGTVALSNNSLPSGNDQEALAVVSNCAVSATAAVYVGEDTKGVDHQVWAYSGYPVTCPVVQPTIIDADADGVASTADCNDNDATVSVNQTYYLDSDGDGLGSTTSISICSSTPSVGYVANHSDLNDADYDNDGVSTSADCNDADSAISVNQTYYQDGDADGLGSDVSVSVCTYTVPSGYVTNSNDLNDSDYDNDGVSTASDCNDRDASLTTAYTFYQDLDGDGMGSSVTTSACTVSAPVGYVTNSNESSNANDLIPNAGVEISGDGRDNDGDGTVDEYNTLSSNGVHPYYSTLDPSNATLAASSIVSFSGAINGYILVKFADNSIYRYSVFSISTKRLTKVRWYSGTGYLQVTSPYGQKVKVNGYTGVKM